MLTTGLLCATSTLSRADDFAPPQYRGLPATVHASWEFATAPTDWTNIAPDEFSWLDMPPIYTLYTGISTHSEVSEPADWHWNAGNGSLEANQSNGPARMLALAIQNEWGNHALTLVRIQLTWDGTAAPWVSSIDGTRDVFGDTPGSRSEGWIIDGRHRYEDWTMGEVEEGVKWDSILLGVPEGTSIDEVVVDQWNILPSPSGALALGATGVIGAIRRRRA